MLNRKLELKISCIQKGITLGELARRLGVTREYISYVIAGERELSYEKKKEASRILNVPVELLFR